MCRYMYMYMHMYSTCTCVHVHVHVLYMHMYRYTYIHVKVNSVKETEQLHLSTAILMKSCLRWDSNPQCCVPGNCTRHVHAHVQYMYMYVQLLRQGKARQLRVRTTPLFS